MTRVRAGALLLAIASAALPQVARADAWTPVTFTGPGGAVAHGFASDAVGGAAARLIVGCESGGADRWRGVALLERPPQAIPTPPGAAGATEVVATFFGRAPVTTRWPGKATADGLLSWPPSGDELRRNLLREDQTRGQATLQLEIRRGDAKQRLVFGVGGIAAHGAEIAAQCDGWGAATNDRRRERGW